jgi:hypothetical protein
VQWWGAKSLADDLITGQGVVPSRAVPCCDLLSSELGGKQRIWSADPVRVGLWPVNVGERRKIVRFVQVSFLAGNGAERYDPKGDERTLTGSGRAGKGWGH